MLTHQTVSYNRELHVAWHSMCSDPKILLFPFIDFPIFIRPMLCSCYREKEKNDSLSPSPKWYPLPFYLKPIAQIQQWQDVQRERLMAKQWNDAGIKPATCLQAMHLCVYECASTSFFFFFLNLVIGALHLCTCVCVFKRNKVCTSLPYKLVSPGI